jgi:hypothetical protein
MTTELHLLRCHNITNLAIAVVGGGLDALDLGRNSFDCTGTL